MVLENRSNNLWKLSSHYLLWFFADYAPWRACTGRTRGCRICNARGTNADQRASRPDASFASSSSRSFYPRSAWEGYFTFDDADRDLSIFWLNDFKSGDSNVKTLSGRVIPSFVSLSIVGGEWVLWREVLVESVERRPAMYLLNSYFKNIDN